MGNPLFSHVLRTLSNRPIDFANSHPPVIKITALSAAGSVHFFLSEPEVLIPGD